MFAGTMKSKELLESFVAYCKAHPHERFWQALRNWVGWGFVWVSNKPLFLLDDEGLAAWEGEDTFYWEENKTP